MKSYITIILVIIVLTAVPLLTYGETVEFKNPIKANSIQELIKFILDIVVKIGAIVAVFMFIVTGFMFVTAQGNPAKIETAKMSLIGTSIGAVVLLGAQLLSTVIENTVKELTK